MECAVFGIKDDRLGEVVGAMLYLKPGQAISASEVAAKVQPKLAAFKLPLAENVFFTAEPLPRGATGKIMKREIRTAVNAEIAKGERKMVRSKL